MSVSDKVGPKRTRLNFTEAVNDRFAFLKELGFSEAESLPTIVRYRKGDLEVDVYHGRQSLELGLGVARRGTRYTLSELIRVTDPDAADRYRNFAATTPKGIAEGVSRLEKLAIRYGERALRGDPEFFAQIENQRKMWAEAYALDVLAGQLRPKADAAFRRGHYQEAAELYSRIRSRLSAAELKKLAVATERAGL